MIKMTMRDSIISLLDDMPIPKMARVKQIFNREKISDIKGELIKQMMLTDITNQLVPGMKIGITAGSRGISDIAKITKTVGDFLKDQGTNPFIVPAMGSHGGATAEGQQELIESYDITEAKMKMPIVSSMQVVGLGQLGNGKPIYLDKNAHKADGIILINRIKPHTAFRASYESGLLKMLTVGLGKQFGADVYHSGGVNKLGEYILEAGKFLLDRVNVIFAVAILENAYGEISKIEVLGKDEILGREPILLQEARKSMPYIKFRDLNLLIVDKIGKNYSGAGMDPNITGKFINPEIIYNPIADKIVILALSDETNGNANGIGLADFISKRALRQMDLTSTYMNSLTSGVTESSKIPMLFDTDKLAIKAAIRLSKQSNPSKLRIVRISNTLELEHIYISEELVKEARGRKDILINDELKPMPFNNKGNLF